MEKELNELNGFYGELLHYSEKIRRQISFVK